MRVGVTVLIPTLNEGCHIERCVRSVIEWADEVIVVDSFSSDDTCEIARRLGARCSQHKFEGYARQKNWALANLDIRNEWILFLDADEYVPHDLQQEIAQVVAADGVGFDGFWMRYRLIFYGKWIRHCGWYPTWILRLVRRKKVEFEDREVDEHAIVNGPCGRLRNDLVHESLRNMDFWIAKHNRYSAHNASIYSRILRQQQGGGLKASFWGSQAERKRFLKEKIWSHLPAKPLFMFVYMYFVRLGFLDGKEGLVFCTMHAVFQLFISVKMWEGRREGQGAPVPPPCDIAGSY